MTTLGPELAPQIIAACTAGAEEAAQAFGRCFGGVHEFRPTTPQSFADASSRSDWNGPALLLLLTVGKQAVAVVLPESSGLLPNWTARPDVTGTAKLLTLAQELGLLLLPEELLPDDFTAKSVANVHEACAQAGVIDGTFIPLRITRDQMTADCALIWPLPNPAAIAAEEPPATKSAAPSPLAPPAVSPLPFAHRPTDASARDLAEALADLPPYIRSLLRIKVQLSVRLAETKLPVKRVVELGPGSIIAFEKSCEEPISLVVGDTEIAVGEAVKSGDKFGLRIGSMVLPAERFFTLKPGSDERRAG